MKNILKKFIVSIIALVVFFGCGFTMIGCSPNTNDPGSSGSGSSTGSGTTSGGQSSGSSTLTRINIREKITESDVRNHSVTPKTDFEYSTSGDGIKITKYLGNDSIVVIPEEIDDKTVNELGPWLFANESKVKGVKFPSTVDTLPTGTFFNNGFIQVIIFESVKIVEDSSIFSCGDLHTLIFGEELEQLGTHTFVWCEDLKYVYIPSSFNSFDWDDYEYGGIAIAWTHMSDVIFTGNPGSFIETFCTDYDLPFQACGSNVPEMPTRLTESDVRNHAVASTNDFTYEEVEGGIKISEYIGTDPILVIPEKINNKSVVDLSSFESKNVQLKGLLIPNSVKKLEDGPSGDELQIIIAEGVEILGSASFGGSQLHTVILSDSLREINDVQFHRAFQLLSDLEYLYISPNVTCLDAEECVDEYVVGDTGVNTFFNCDDLIIRGQKDSYIHRFCIEHNLAFEVVER